METEKKEKGWLHRKKADKSAAETPTAETTATGADSQTAIAGAVTTATTAESAGMTAGEAADMTTAAGENSPAAAPTTVTAATTTETAGEAAAATTATAVETPAAPQAVDAAGAPLPPPPPVIGDDGPRRRRRRWLRRRRAEEIPEVPLPPALQVRPFDGRDYRMLSLLLGGFKAEMGEQPLTQRQWAQLRNAIEEGRITYYVAYLSGEPVGICSLCETYSSYQCTAGGVFEDFFVLPQARGRGVARALVQQACGVVRARGGHTLTVACPPTDTELYQALGFTDARGTSLSCPL